MPRCLHAHIRMCYRSRYELHPSEDNVTVGVYMKFSSSRKATIEYNRVPLVLSLPREATHDKLYEILLQTCSRFINLSKETKFTTSHNSGAYIISVSTVVHYRLFVLWFTAVLAVLVVLLLFDLLCDTVKCVCCYRSRQR